MTLQEEIKSAVGSHAIWKARLNSAIDTRSSQFAPATVRRDDQCEFGKWLETANAAVRASAEYSKCKELHHRFHGEAAKVLDLALAGKKEAARQAVGADGAFVKISSSLTMAMMEWSRAAPR